MLSFAALTTSIALMEIPTLFLMRAWNWSRARSVSVVVAAAALLAVPAALSKGAVSWLSQMEIKTFGIRGFYEIMDFTWGGLAMIATGLGLTVFVGWIWGPDAAARELLKGAHPRNRKWLKWWQFHIKYIAPAILIGLLVASVV